MPFFLTLAAASAVGFLFLKGKVPGGVMVGALVGTVVLNVGAGLAYMQRRAEDAEAGEAGGDPPLQYAGLKSGIGGDHSCHE